jgi:threonine dehydrogenase-like Zn-dependent dehydrogenase
MRMLKMEGNGVVTVIDAPEPVPGRGEVVVETAVSALCGSELHSYRGAGFPRGNGGHEAAGTVVATGPGVLTPEVGQRVGLSAVVGCGHCAFCARGQYTWCPDRRVQGNMHAERILTAAHGCHLLPNDVDWDAGVLLSGDGMGVPYHTSTRLTDPLIETVAIFGVGPIGLGNTLLQAHLGRRVIAVDVSPARLELAQQLGATHTIHAPDIEPVAQIQALTGGRGADVCLEAAGRPETLKQCFAAVRTGGTVVMNGEQPSVELSPSQDFIRRDITALGSWYYHFSEFPRMLALYREGLNITKLITHCYPLDEAATAFREFAAARTGKVLLTLQS